MHLRKPEVISFFLGHIAATGQAPSPGGRRMLPVLARTAEGRATWRESRNKNSVAHSTVTRAAAEPAALLNVSAFPPRFWRSYVTSAVSEGPVTSHGRTGVYGAVVKCAAVPCRLRPAHSAAPLSLDYAHAHDPTLSWPSTTLQQRFGHRGTVFTPRPLPATLPTPHSKAELFTNELKYRDRLWGSSSSITARSSLPDYAVKR